jgi:hypothetical protein
MNSIDEFLDRIQSVRRRLGVEKSPPWFRGHSQTSYTLTPSLLRREFLEKFNIKDFRQFEKNLVCDFITRAGDTVPHHFDNWHLLGMMRHYEMPTRMLDWTTSLSVALYFAIGEDSTNPHLWVMNPYLLNKKTTDKIIVFDAVDQMPFSFFECLTSDARYPYSGPIALKPAMTNPRIRAQRGCFTFHGDGLGKSAVPCPTLISELSDRIAIKIDIPKTIIPKLGLLLELDGIDDYFVYPELHNLSNSIKKSAAKRRSPRS